MDVTISMSLNELELKTKARNASAGMISRHEKPQKNKQKPPCFFNIEQSEIPIHRENIENGKYGTSAFGG